MDSSGRTLPNPLRRRRRASARAALYTGVLIVGACAVALGLWLSSWGPRVEVDDWSAVDYSRDPSVQFLREYIAIDTSIPDGDPPAGAELIAERLRADGVPVVVERVGEKDVNLWAVIEGEDPRALVLHHHIDVEAVNRPEAWKHPPFAGTIDGPWLYGRGAFDMKSVAVAQVEAFLGVARRAASGRRPLRSVILLATSGEETGSELGMRWLLRNHPALVERFGVVLTEGGVVEGRSVDDVKYWGTEFVQRRILSVTVCGGDRDRLEGLRGELLEDLRQPSEIVVTPELRVFLKSYAPSRDREDWRRWLADPDRLARNVVELASMPAYVQAMFRNQAVPRSVREVDGGWELAISVQMVPGSDPDPFLERTLPAWRRHGLSLAVYDEGGSSHGSPVEHEVMGAIHAVLSDRYPGAGIGPMYLPWTLTDARFLRARGIASFGFTPFMVMTPEVLTWVAGDSSNERIALPGFVEGVSIYAQLVDRLTTDRQPGRG